MVPTEATSEEIEQSAVPDMFVSTVTKAPVLLAVLADRRVIAEYDRDLERTGIVSGASIYPFVWNLSLIHISEPTRLNSTSRMPSSA